MIIHNLVVERHPDTTAGIFNNIIEVTVYHFGIKVAKRAVCKFLDTAAETKPEVFLLILKE